jgi:hypothetical protein
MAGSGSFRPCIDARTDRGAPQPLSNPWAESKRSSEFIGLAINDD